MRKELQMTSRTQSEAVSDMQETEELSAPSMKNPFRSILQKDKGKYFWVYEQPMMKCFFLLFEVWRVLGLGCLITLLLLMLFDLFQGKGLSSLWGTLQLAGISFGIIMALSLPAYYIVTKANNGRYTVLFEMDDEGIDHIQIKTEKARALDLLTVFVGSAAKNKTTTAAGLLSASGGSLYSPFSTVRKIRAYPEKNMIRLNGVLIRNQIYADDEDFDAVYDYIVTHCPNADAKYIS